MWGANWLLLISGACGYTHAGVVGRRQKVKRRREDGEEQRGKGRQENKFPNDE